ncbi:MAG TPA: hypothetical protein VF993_02825 [Myxococcales bacterium]
MEPLGSYDRLVAPSTGIALGALGVLSATALFELSRTLAETYKGRWFAGNGRDVFHVAAVGVLASALFVNGLPPALACFAAATAAVFPLLILDSLPARRPVRVAFLLALVALAAAPPLLQPRSIVGACNAMARILFP